MATLNYILGLLLGALITATLLYIMKLRNEVKKLKKVIKEQHKLIEALTIAAFGDKIKEHLGKKDCDCAKEHTRVDEPTCDANVEELLRKRECAKDTAE